MIHATIRWAAYLTALLILGPIAGMAIGSLRASDGGLDATPLLCTAPATGIIIGVAIILGAGLVGAITARFVGWTPGMSTAGIIIAWAAWRGGDVQVMLRQTQSGATLKTLAMEGAILGIAAILAAALILAAANDLKEKSQPFARRLVGQFKSGLGSPGVALAIPVAIIAGAVAVWLVAQGSLKGQVFAAGIASGILGAAAGRIVDLEAKAITFIAAAALLCVLGPIAGLLKHGGGGGMVQAAYAGELFALANLTPMDWLAGAFVGVPIGMSWAASMIEKRLAD